jgi:hypothetical protein
MTLLNQCGKQFSKIMKMNAVQGLLLIAFMIVAQSTFADDSLAPGVEVVKDTYNGSIKTYLYLGEAVAAIATLIFTRNIKTLGGVGAMAIFLNVVAALAGV